jgi:hypothetical protein
MTAAIKQTATSQLTVPINSSVIGQASVLLAMAPDTGREGKVPVSKKEPRPVSQARPEG